MKTSTEEEYLSLKLKDAMIKRLTANEQTADEDYIMISGDTYSRREIAAEIEAQSEIGIKLLINVIMLSLDIMTRTDNLNKVK